MLTGAGPYPGQRIDEPNIALPHVRQIAAPSSTPTSTRATTRAAKMPSPAWKYCSVAGPTHSAINSPMIPAGFCQVGLAKESNC